MKNKKCAVKTALQICPFARRAEGKECTFIEYSITIIITNQRSPLKNNNSHITSIAILRCEIHENILM